MRPSQFLIRLVVFSCIVLDPSDGGVGLAIGVVLGATIGFTAAGIKLILKNRKNVEADE